ncbi:hypothetical protein IT575_10765 [bacterium]|nr:hypothetical protein [bacterium]
MRSIDYGWVIALVIIVLLVIFWKPIMGLFGAAKDTAVNKPKLDAGKAVFDDPKRWMGENSYRSCAMCHDPAFTPEDGKKVDMQEYVEGKPVILKDIKQKLAGNNLGTDDAIVDQINRCITMPTRIGSGGFSRNAPFMDDLIFYVSSL